MSHMENSKYHPPKYTESVYQLADLLDVKNIDLALFFEKQEALK